MEWSDEIYQISGVDSSVIPDLDFITGLLHPDDLDYVQENIDLAIHNVKIYDVAHRIIRAE